MSAFGDLGTDLVEMQLHRMGIGIGQHQGRALAPHPANSAEEVGVLIALIGGQSRARPLPGPNPSAAILLTDTVRCAYAAPLGPRSHLTVLKPNLDAPALGQMAYVGFEGAAEGFFKSSMT